MKDLRILPDVSTDLANAANWYDKKGYDGLGDRFLATFYASLHGLRDRGEVHRIVYSDFRRILLKPFPFALYYRYFGDWIVVSLVIHAARDPSLVQRLLRERQP
jgi:hypothetical protein